MFLSVVQYIWENILGRPWKNNSFKKIEMNIHIRIVQFIQHGNYHFVATTF